MAREPFRVRAFGNPRQSIDPHQLAQVVLALVRYWSAQRERGNTIPRPRDPSD
jgi:hypothetical protein